MARLLTLAFTLICMTATAQSLSVSDEFFIGGADGYGIIGKYNDRILYFLLENKKVKLRALDNKMHKMWEREIEPDRKNNASILDVVGTKQDFSILYQYRKKNRNYIKIHKYDGQAKLLDSVTVFDWGKDVLVPKLDILISEDKKSVLIYEIIESRQIKALAVSLDSLRPIWDKTLSFRADWYKPERFEQFLFTNQGEFYAITEENNRIGTEKHYFDVLKYSKNYGEHSFKLPMKDIISLDVKFSYDNVNQQLVAAGLYSAKNFLRAQGHFFISLTPQYNEGAPFKLALHPFDDELASALLGKKITESKGLTDLKIQDIVHRRDGGILAVVEQVKAVDRRASFTTSSGMSNRGYISMDYFYENAFALSIAPDGQAQWRSIFHKKQFSQDDEARFSSFFLAKTPSALRFLFNDEIERSTTVSEFVLNGAGEGERHAIMNTQGQELYLRFKDALQVAANEIVVPSDDKRRVKLVKIQY
ncbi:MAG: hypothetical protein JNL70_27400 [Saprospiraceae bacterium]|nr:hypothetical protein [Saprospiraceae bacterium]